MKNNPQLILLAAVALGVGYVILTGDTLTGAIIGGMSGLAGFAGILQDLRAQNENFRQRLQQLEKWQSSQREH